MHVLKLSTDWLQRLDFITNDDNSVEVCKTLHGTPLIVKDFKTLLLMDAPGLG